MDILDDFPKKKDDKITYHCIKDGCGASYVSKGKVFMVCKLHGDDRPVMRYDGKKEKELDDYFSPDDYLAIEEQEELMKLISQVGNKILSVEAYYQKLIKFWKSNGFPDFSEKDLPLKT